MDVMIDLETLSTMHNAVILTLGAIRFDRNKDVPKFEELDQKNVFYRRINIQSCVKAGMHVSDETKKWWDEQNKEVRDEAMYNQDGRVDITDALDDFRRWMGNGYYGYRVWGNGSIFDITILEQAYILCGIQIPWKFWLVRDLRTLFDIGGVRMKDLLNDDKNESTKHHAVHDCYRQIVGFRKAMKNIGK